MALREERILVTLTLIGFAVNLIGGIVGGIAETNSRAQLLGWRIGDTGSVMAAVTASRYVGLRGFHVAASGLVMLAISHGIAAAGSGIEQVSNEGVSLVVPLVPTLIMMWWCDLLPKWSRIVGLLLIAGFVHMYYRVVFLHLAVEHWTTYICYLLLALVELMWGVFLWKDHGARRAAARATGS